MLDKRLVLFLDILGWKDFVKERENNPDAVKEALDILYSSFTKGNINTKHVNSMTNVAGEETFPNMLLSKKISEPMFSSQSDCVVVSYKIEKSCFLPILAIISEVIKAQIQMLEDKKLLLRGGITYGNLYHDRRYVFGSALQRAYKLESEIARYPRVIIDQSVFDFLDGKSSKEELKKHQRLLKDEDRAVYINYPKFMKYDSLIKSCKHAKDIKAKEKQVSEFCNSTRWEFVKKMPGRKNEVNYDKTIRWGWLETKLEKEIKSSALYNSDLHPKCVKAHSNA